MKFVQKLKQDKYQNTYYFVANLHWYIWVLNEYLCLWTRYSSQYSATCTLVTYSNSTMYSGSTSSLSKMCHSHCRALHSHELLSRFKISETSIAVIIDTYLRMYALKKAMPMYRYLKVKQYVII